MSDRWCARVKLGFADGLEQRGHDRVQRLVLCQTGADEQGQAPQALRLCSSSPGSYAAIKRYLELALKLLAKVRVMLGCAQ